MTLIGCLSSILAQQTIQNQDLYLDIQAISAFNVNGNRLGGILQLEKRLLGNNWYGLSAGLYEELFWKDEGSIVEIQGHTLSQQFGGCLSNRFASLPIPKLYASHSLYVGWGYRRSRATFTNAQYNIQRDYQSAYHYLAVGMYWKLGLNLSDSYGLHVIGKTDFSRLLGPYEATTFERPGFMYGIGMQVRF